jgi:hypothetical protein
VHYQRHESEMETTNKGITEQQTDGTSSALSAVLVSGCTKLQTEIATLLKKSPII